MYNIFQLTEAEWISLFLSVVVAFYAIVWTHLHRRREVRLQERLRRLTHERAPSTQDEETYAPTGEEWFLVKAYSEATATKRTLAWTAAIAVVSGLFVMPVGLLLWGIAVILSWRAVRVSEHIRSISNRVGQLRSFDNPQEPKVGTLVSLAAGDSILAGNDWLVGRVVAAWEYGGEAEILSEPLGGRHRVSTQLAQFWISRGDRVEFAHISEDEEDEALLIVTRLVPRSMR